MRACRATRHYLCQAAGSLVRAPRSVDARRAAQGLRFLLVAGKPIGEPIVQHGPFVMNTQGEIRQAFADYQSGKLQSADDNVWQAWK